MEKFSIPLALAYASENAETARAIEQDLAAVFTFTHFAIERDQAVHLTALLSGYEGPILLLVSDNFLRSTKCMQEGLAMITEHEDQLLPIMIPGYRLTEAGSQENVPTSFERVSDIIQYINYWQDRYLELRRQKREDPDLDNEGFGEHLRRVRIISADAGEHIRFLRNLDYVKWEELQASNYAELFDFLGEEELAENYYAHLNEASAPTPEEEESETPPNLPADDTPEDTEMEEHPMELAGIPGVHLLPNVLEEENSAAAEMNEPAAETPPVELDDIPGINLILPSEVEKIAPETTAPIAEPEAVQLSEQPPIIANVETAINPEQSIKQTWQLVDNGKTGEALSLLERSLAQSPEDQQLRYNYALLLAQENQVEAANTVVQQVLEKNPKSEHALFLAGELADIRQDGPRAIQYFSLLTQLYPQNGEAWYQLALSQISYQPDASEASARYLKKAVKLLVDSEPPYQLALLYQSENQPAKAEKYFQKALERDPEHAAAYYGLSLVQYGTGKHVKALENYQQAFALQPDFQTAENDAAFKLAAQKQVMREEQATIDSLRAQVEELQQHIRETATGPAAHHRPGEGLTVLITGATSGIGKATAALLASEGYRLIITGRRQERLAELQQNWSTEYQAQIHPLAFDVRDPKAANKAIENLPKEWSTIDILINNAGKAKGFDPIHEGQLEHWEEMIDTNIKGLLYLTRAISPSMVARGSGHIVNVASTAGKEVYPKGNVYCATKFAVDALTRGMRLDLHQHGVRVSQVAPAHVEETEFAVVRFDGDTERAKIYDDFQPLTSRDVATTIAYILQQPAHVNVLDVVLQGTQQASSTVIDRSGRKN